MIFVRIRKIKKSKLQQSGLVRKAVGFYRIPIGKPDDLCRTVLKIK